MKQLLYSPMGRAFSAMISTFGSGLICSATITDITVDGKLVWSNLKTSNEFWILIGFFVILVVYYYFMYQIDVVNEAALADYQDHELLVAMARKEQMKELKKWSKKQAKLGNLDKLHSLDQFLKREGEFGNGSSSDDRTGEGKGTGTS